MWHTFLIKDDIKTFYFNTAFNEWLLLGVNCPWLPAPPIRCFYALTLCALQIVFTITITITILTEQCWLVQAKDLIERDIMSDHASQAVDNCRQRHSTRSIAVAVHLRCRASEIKHRCSLNTQKIHSIHLNINSLWRLQSMSHGKVYESLSKQQRLMSHLTYNVWNFHVLLCKISTVFSFLLISLLHLLQIYIIKI